MLLSYLGENKAKQKICVYMPVLGTLQKLQSQNISRQKIARKDWVGPEPA